ncbi:hypothetical protein VTI74DRAFT_9580 [Chaetomium olivicolor]
MDIAHQLQVSLAPTSTPLPSIPWLRNLVSSRTPPPPLASLLATARARLLASDLTTPGLLDTQYAAAHCLPPDLPQTHANTRETRLARDVVVQVLDIEDVSRSRWEQVEELEGIARGEGTRGREVVRLPTTTTTAAAASGVVVDGDYDEEGGLVVDAGEEATQVLQTQGGGGGGAAAGGQQQGQGSGGSSRNNSTHKLAVQDCKGQKVHAIELRRVERLAVGKTFIGEKILLRAGTVVARGVVLLDPAQCVVLGGKVEAWHRAWVDGRLARLKEAVEAERRS